MFRWDRWSSARRSRVLPENARGWVQGYNAELGCRNVWGRLRLSGYPAGRDRETRAVISA